MKLTLINQLRLKRYPGLTQTQSHFDRKAIFEEMVKEKDNIPLSLYAYYIRFHIQIDTNNVPLDLMERAVENIPRKYLMSKEELKRYKKLPEKITIYRGTDKTECPPRLSWSLNAATAQRFTRGRIYKATIAKESIIAYFCEDTVEEEILVSLKDNYEIIDSI